MGDKIEAGLASAQDFQRAHDIKEQLAKLHLGFFYFWLQRQHLQCKIEDSWLVFVICLWVQVAQPLVMWLYP
jgi:hypothetical protein